MYDKYYVVSSKGSLYLAYYKPKYNDVVFISDSQLKAEKFIEENKEQFYDEWESQNE